MGSSSWVWVLVRCARTDGARFIDDPGLVSRRGRAPQVPGGDRVISVVAVTSTAVIREAANTPPR